MLSEPHSTVCSFQQAVAMFWDYSVDGRYGWGVACEKRFGTRPVQISRMEYRGPRRGLVFPWARGSNYRCNTFEPAATAADWPRTPDGRRAWTFRSLRHVFATWALAQPGARIEDVSRLLGHSQRAGDPGPVHIPRPGAP
jgi:hypothetical protein